MQNECSRHARGQMREDSLEFIEPLRVSNLIGRVVVRGGTQLGKDLRNIDRDRFARVPHRVLVNYVTGNGEKIGFRTANAFRTVDAQ